MLNRIFREVLLLLVYDMAVQHESYSSCDLSYKYQNKPDTPCQYFWTNYGIVLSRLSQFICRVTFSSAMIKKALLILTSSHVIYE